MKINMNMKMYMEMNKDEAIDMNMDKDKDMETWTRTWKHGQGQGNMLIVSLLTNWSFLFANGLNGLASMRRRQWAWVGEEQTVVLDQVLEKTLIFSRGKKRRQWNYPLVQGKQKYLDRV
jgi:hypothetical protein